MIRQSVFAAAAALGLSVAAFAQDKPAAEQPKEEIKPMTIGDAARPIDISSWLKGEPVSKMESGKVYVLEFWATWCGPCRASMPHISEVQKQYKDYGVTFIGVSDEPLPTVVKFLCSKDKDGALWFDKIDYTLATDPDKSVMNDYFRAAGQNGIPCAFIIGKDQHIEWIGHPMEIEKPLEGVVKDSWDRQAFKTKWEKETAAERDMVKTQQDLRKAMNEKNWDKAVELLDAQIAKNDEAFGPQFQKFSLLLKQMNEPKKAYALGEAIAKQNWDNAMVLNQIAWYVADTPDIQTRDLDFALRLAAHANELASEKDGAILDTYARVYFEKGDLTNAVRIEKKAVEHSPEGPMAEEIAKTLKKYEDAAAAKSKG